MVDMFVKVMLALLAVGLVAYPLLAPPREDEEERDPPEDLEELHRRKESTYAAIKELEFDFRTGKLSEEDFHALDARYRMDALELIDAIEAFEGEGPTAARSRASDDPAGGGALSLIHEWARDVPHEPVADVDMDGDEWLCRECGSSVSTGHRFCASCGSEVVA